jgi:phosphohistidine phosphatase
MRNILVMRHGKPERNICCDDFDMPLSEAGRRAAARAGQTILERGIVPDIIISSPAVRAEETARIVAENCLYPKDIAINTAFYFDTTDAAVAALKALPGEIRRPLLIGHNPTWTELVFTLQENPQIIAVKPATLVSLTLVGMAWRDIMPGTCSLDWVI